MYALIRKNAILLSLLIFIFLVLIYGVATDSVKAAYFINGIVANIFDPFVWLIVIPFILMIHRNKVLLPILLIVAILVYTFKLYIGIEIIGSIVGNLTGFITIGYIINTVVIFLRRSRKSTN